jgi:hypothetical protein
VIRETQPQVVTIEKVFVSINPQSTLLLGQARGAAICAAAAVGLAVHEYAALKIKQAVVGFGGADKRQVQAMVQRLLLLDRAPVADAADALACAICHAHSFRAGRGDRPHGRPGGHARRWGRAPRVGRARRESQVIGRLDGTFCWKRIRRRSWSTSTASATKSTCR